MGCSSTAMGYMPESTGGEANRLSWSLAQHSIASCEKSQFNYLLLRQGIWSLAPYKRQKALAEKGVWGKIPLGRRYRLPIL